VDVNPCIETRYIPFYRRENIIYLSWRDKKRGEMGAIGLEPYAEYSQPLSGCGARILAALKTESESFMPFCLAELASAEFI
jgi:hypothetical protein